MLREDSDRSALRTGPRYRPWSRYRSGRPTRSHRPMLPLVPAPPCALRLPPRRSHGLARPPLSHAITEYRTAGSQGLTAMRPAGHPSPCGACNRCASPSQRRGGSGRAAGRGRLSGGPITPMEISPSHRDGQPDASRCDRGPGQETRPHNRRPPPTYVRSARPLLRGGPTSAESRHASARLPRASAGPQK